MLLSETIKELGDILEKQGDCELFIDIPERKSFTDIFSIEGNRYIGNHWKDHKPINNAFIVITEFES